MDFIRYVDESDHEVYRTFNFWHSDFNFSEFDVVQLRQFKIAPKGSGPG